MDDGRIVAAPAFDGWAILELMGHRVRAGRVQEVEIAGGKMIRIDIPTFTGEDVTEFYASSAIYALRPCSEGVAREMAGVQDPRPVKPVDFRPAEQRALAYGEFDD
jgi:hypothetical protein